MMTIICKVVLKEESDKEAMLVYKEVNTVK